MVEWRLHQVQMLRLEHRHRWPDGSETCFHGHDPRSLALTLRTHPGPAVSVVAIGPYDEVETYLTRWPAPSVELARAHPPIVVKYRGRRHCFHPENGPSFVGSVKAGSDAILLLGIEGQRVVIELGDGDRFRRCVSLPLDEIPQCIDLDELAERSRSGRKTAKSRAERPPGMTAAKMRSESARILEGPASLPVHRVRASQVIALWIRAVVREAKTTAATPDERRVVDFVGPVIEALYELRDDVRDNATAIHGRLLGVPGGDRLPGIRNFILTLKLTAKIAPYLFGSTKREDWHIYGYGLHDLHHPVFEAICERMGTGCGQIEEGVSSAPAARDRAAPRAATKRRRGTAPVQLGLWPEGDPAPAASEVAAEPSVDPAMEIDPRDLEATAAAIRDRWRIGELSEAELERDLRALLRRLPAEARALVDVLGRVAEEAPNADADPNDESLAAAVQRAVARHRHLSPEDGRATIDPRDLAAMASALRGRWAAGELSDEEVERELRGLIERLPPEARALALVGEQFQATGAAEDQPAPTVSEPVAATSEPVAEATVDAGPTVSPRDRASAAAEDRVVGEPRQPPLDAEPMVEWSRGRVVAEFVRVAHWILRRRRLEVIEATAVERDASKVPAASAASPAAASAASPTPAAGPADPPSSRSSAAPTRPPHRRLEVIETTAIERDAPQVPALSAASPAAASAASPDPAPSVAAVGPADPPSSRSGAAPPLPSSLVLLEILAGSGASVRPLQHRHNRPDPRPRLDPPTGSDDRSPGLLREVRRITATLGPRGPPGGPR